LQGTEHMLTNPSELNDLTRDIIGSAIQVHRELGPGLLESAYSACLTAELRIRNHQVGLKIPVPLVYREVRIEVAYWIDMLVDDRVIVELKAVEKLAPIHQAQLLTYLRLTSRPIGLLINFNEVMLKNGVKRLVNPKAK